MFNLSERPPLLKTAYDELIIVGIICMAQFLNQAAVSQILSIMNIIGASFKNATAGDKTWFMAAFPLTVGTFILVSGKIGDLYGFKKVFVLGYLWTTVWSLIAGLTVYTDSVVFFIICRAMQGIGFACLLPCGMGLLGLMYPNGTRKDLVFGILGACAPAGATMGVLISASFAEKLWWPWSFWGLSIVTAVLSGLSVLFIPNIIAEHNTNISKYRQMDWIGSLIGIVALVLINFSWNQAPLTGWSSPYIITLLVIGMVLVFVFFYYETRCAKFPLLPKSIFNRHIGLILSVISFGWGSFGIWSYYYWLFTMNLRGYSPITASLCYLPLLFMGIVASLTTSYLISRTRPSYLICFASLCFFSGCVMLAVTPVHQTYFKLLFGQMLSLSWGMDMSFPSAAILLSNYLPPHHQGMAGSLISTMVNYSMSFYLGVAGTAETQVLAKTNDVLKSYRVALYVGIGVSALASLLSVVFIITSINYVADPEKEGIEEGNL